MAVIPKQRKSISNSTLSSRNRTEFPNKIFFKKMIVCYNNNSICEGLSKVLFRVLYFFLIAVAFMVTSMSNIFE